MTISAKVSGDENSEFSWITTAASGSRCPPDGRVEVSVERPPRVLVDQGGAVDVRADLVGARVRGIADDEVPSLVRRDVVEAVGEVHVDDVLEPVPSHRLRARLHGRRVHVGQTQRLAQSVPEEREADEARTRAPLERPSPRSEPRRDEIDVVLAIAPAAAVELLGVDDLDPAEDRRLESWAAHSAATLDVRAEGLRPADTMFPLEDSRDLS